MSIPERTKINYNKLYWYYRETVDFMLKKYDAGEQGVLIAHSPGLGKTPISCVFASALFERMDCRFFLFVVPKSVIEQWRHHLMAWAQIPVFVYNGLKAKRVEEFHKFIRAKKGVIVVTYATLQNDCGFFEHYLAKVRSSIEQNYQRLSSAKQPQVVFTSMGNSILDERIKSELLAKHSKSSDSQTPIESRPKDFVIRNDVSFDIAIFDEITEIKNERSKSFKMFSQLKTKMKIGLTGTPVMNNLKELYNIVHFISPGFLGQRKEFVSSYASAISAAQLKDATPFTKMIGYKYQKQLISELNKIMFRKTKEQLHALDCNKHEILVWINMGELYLSCYEAYINSKHFKRYFHILRAEQIIPFEVISVLRKLAEHCLKLNEKELYKMPPELRCQLYQMQHYNGVILATDTESDLEFSDDETKQTETTVTSLPDDGKLENPSSKMEVLLGLLTSFKERGLKTIVFTEHRTMLNLIQNRIQTELNFNCFRIDGSIISPKERQIICNNFNNIDCFYILLMTIKAGGVGLNLQGAKRVIIFSPNWNPQIEEYAVARAWRLGQEQDVYVYKLITRNTIEEKLVARQFQKLQIANATTCDLNTKTKVRAAEILELLICRLITQEGKYKVIYPVSTDTIEGIEGTLDNGFSVAEFEVKVDEKELAMVKALYRQFYRFNLRINCQNHDYKEDSDDIDADQQLTQSQLQLYVPTIYELRARYNDEGQDSLWEPSNDVMTANALLGLGSSPYSNTQSYPWKTSIESPGYQRPVVEPYIDYDMRYFDFERLPMQSQSETDYFPANVRRKAVSITESSGEDDLPSPVYEFVSRTVSEYSETMPEISETEPIVVSRSKSSVQVIDVDEIDIFYLTYWPNRSGAPAIVDLSD